MGPAAGGQPTTAQALTRRPTALALSSKLTARLAYRTYAPEASGHPCQDHLLEDDSGALPLSPDPAESLPGCRPASPASLPPTPLHSSSLAGSMNHLGLGLKCVSVSASLAPAFPGSCQGVLICCSGLPAGVGGQATARNSHKWGLSRACALPPPDTVVQGPMGRDPREGWGNGWISQGRPPRSSSWSTRKAEGSLAGLMLLPGEAGSESRGHPCGLTSSPRVWKFCSG